MAQRFKVLVLNHDEDDEKEYKKATSYNDTISNVFKEHKIKLANNESYQEGKRVDKFDMVIALLKDHDDDDIEMSEDFYNHYLVAPVTYCLALEDKSEFIKKKFGDHINCMECEDPVKAIVEAFEAGQKAYAEKFEKDVKTAFAKFDKDNSGAIDREELGQLSKELGTELTEEQLTAALVDLDLNKDGVVDLDEFCRWYFTGMKPYNGGRRTLLQLGSKSMKLINVLEEETKNILLSQELKTKSSSMSIGFNVPQDP